MMRAFHAGNAAVTRTGQAHLMHTEPRPVRGVCVVTVERQPAAPTLITVLVVPDLARPTETLRRHVISARDALDDVRAFLIALGDDPVTPPV
jgi:hypothetical protein